MNNEKDIFAEKLRREYRLINQQYFPYAILFVVLLGVLVYVLWNTAHAGRTGEAVALSLVFGFGYIAVVGVAFSRWFDLRKRARTQNTMSNSAAHAPTRRLDDVKIKGGEKCKTGEPSSSS